MSFQNFMSQIEFMKFCQNHWSLLYSILSLQASVVSVQGPIPHYFEPLKLSNFDFSADPDPASKKIMRIHADPGVRIRNPGNNFSLQLLQT
jgi:hypothetical protein